MKDLNQEFDERFDNTFWAELKTEGYFGDADTKKILAFIREREEQARKEERESLIKWADEHMCDEKKVSYFNDVEFRGHDEKQLASAVLNELIKYLNQ